MVSRLLMQKTACFELNCQEPTSQQAGSLCRWVIQVSKVHVGRLDELIQRNILRREKYIEVTCILETLCVENGLKPRRLLEICANLC